MNTFNIPLLRRDRKDTPKLLLSKHLKEIKSKRLPLETKNTLLIETGVSVLFRLFISSSEVCNTAYVL